MTIPVSELFGPTLQGEGPFAGRAVQFLRLGGCNLSCSWCDTPYTWDGSRYDLREEIQNIPANEIVPRLLRSIPLVLSGGEPLLHQHNSELCDVLGRARELGCAVHVETNGTLAPEPGFRDLVDAWAVSPKLDHAGPHRTKQDPALHSVWPGLARADLGVALKVVVRDEQDVWTVNRLMTEWSWPRAQVWVMPLGTTSAELLKHWPDIASAAADIHINATQRLHILAWGDRKGT